ncbi:MAG TPA: serine/threonine-protein kinase [Gemmatimonadales bacterium]|jgi:eukaryotic-like serine/threonine-protein kinase|nr:serine/threonine-protein kinase [Gemmatimonadales bacterium]
MRRDLLPMVQEALRDRYTVEREMARGGAGRVFFARTLDGQAVALKVLHPELVVTATADRFLREIKTLSRLEHPRVARLLDYGERDWLVYLATAYIEGPTLKEHIAQVRRVSVDDAVRIGRDVLDALAYAHKHNVVHRDVKPDNIVLAREGAMLLDFGIARAIEAAGDEKLTRSGFTVGTSSYMSPEQVVAVRDLDHRSDLYSLGCVLFEALAGRPPFVHRSEAVVLQLQQTAEAPLLAELRPEVPAPLAGAIQRALAKAREDRWTSALEMRAQLDRLP